MSSSVPSSDILETIYTAGHRQLEYENQLDAGHPESPK